MSATGTGGPGSPATGPTLERDVELKCLRWVVDEATAGRGRLLVVEGPSGIGKSRLLDEARAMASEAGVDVLHARGGELERDYPFGVVVHLLEARSARASAAQRGRLFEGRAALAAPLLGRGDEDVPHAATSDEFALMHGLYWCVVNLSEQRPVVLLVDDVHWADDLSLRFLIYLAQRLEDLPVALIVAVRTGDPTAESALVAQLSAAGSVPSLTPAELGLDAVSDILAELPLAVREDFVVASWRATAGNPFLLREIVAAILAEPEAWRSADPARVEAFAPHSVGRSVVLRLARLGSDALKLARACAVLGEASALATAARLAALEPATAHAKAERLVDSHILSRVEPVCFAHPMIRSALYAELPPGDRLRAHAAAATLLHAEGAPADRVAHHLVAGTPSDEAWARQALHDAARAAARKGAPSTAVRYLRRAIDLSPPGEHNAAMLVDLGLVEAAAGETTSLARFEQALATIEEPQEQARALYALGQTQYRYGRQDEAITTFRRGAKLFEGGDRELWLMFEGAVACAALFVVESRRAAMARAESLVVSIPDDRPATASERVLLAALAVMRGQTVAPAAPSAMLALRALGDGELLRQQTSESLAVNLAIVGLLTCGRPDDAQRALEAVLSDARERGSALAFAEASMVRAMIMYARGRIGDAIADAQAAIGGIERGWHSGVPIPQAILAHCLIERGQLDLADAVLRSVEPILRGPASPALNAYFHCARGRLRLAQSEPSAALEDLLEAGRIFERYGAVNPAMLPWRSLAALAANGTGDRALALRLAEESVSLARAFGLSAQVGAALHVRGIVESGSESRRSLAEAVAVLEDADAPLELARALLDLGSAHRRAGRRVECRQPLRRALDLAHQCGATAMAQRARDELLASGARPRRPVITGVDSLTPSERRIATLAAAGHSNRGIAETLFLTKNTVQWHLRHVYRKLDVASRDGLRARLDDKREPSVAA